MRVLITGGTGLIGSALQQWLIPKGFDLVIASRKPPIEKTANVTYIEYNGKTLNSNAIGKIDAIINLAGAHVADHRWTKEYKKVVVSSRLDATQACVNLIHELAEKPGVFISGSAVGYYGTHRTTVLEETDGPGNDFLSEVGVQWEAAAQGTGIRTVISRIGVVLSQKGGAFPKLLAPFKYYAGGYLGTGEQGFPWIHIRDVVGLMEFALTNENVSGPINFTAPEILNNREIAAILGKVLHRPCNLPIPNFVVRMMMGESAMLVLEGQKVKPAKALRLGYNFHFPRAEAAIRDLLGLQ
jgi:uncharacterized protein (TIGR01777 family)